MPRLLVLTASELTRDPRARRQVAAARAHGYEVVGVSGQVSGEDAVPLEGATVVRVGRRRRADWAHESGLRPRHSSSVVRELRGVSRLARGAIRTALLVGAARRAAPADVVHANDFDTLPAAWLVARRWRARLIYDAHELYSEFDEDPSRIYRRVLAALEGTLARRAGVITVSETLADELQQRLRLAARPTVVLNTPPLAPAEAAVGGRPLRVIYQGSFGTGRPLDELLDGVSYSDNILLTIRAVRIEPSLIEAAVAERGLGDRVKVAAPLPPDGVMRGLAGQHVGLIFDRPVTRNGELTLPNKLFEYLMGGLAVVVPRVPELGRLVEQERVGLAFEPGDPVALGRTLARLAADDELVKALQARAREVALERYNAEAQAERLVAVWTGTP